MHLPTPATYPVNLIPFLHITFLFSAMIALQPTITSCAHVIDCREAHDPIS
jgi:hypothetical protein